MLQLLVVVGKTTLVFLLYGLAKSRPQFQRQLLFDIGSIDAGLKPPSTFRSLQGIRTFFRHRGIKFWIFPDSVETKTSGTKFPFGQGAAKRVANEYYYIYT